jgi:benzoyl-CoA reductase subunit C
LDVPRRATEEAARYYAHNLRILWKELKDRSGVVADEEDLWRVIAEYRRTREFIARLSALSWRQPPVLAGSRVAETVRMVARSPKLEFNRWLASNLAVLEGGGEKNSLGAGDPSGRTGASASARGPRLLVTGSIAPPGLIDRLEKLGAQIVADDLCTGARYWWRPTENRTQGADGSDPFLFLARSYLRRLPCPRMIGDGWRWQSLVERIKEYRIDGVVFYNTKFCDFYHYALPFVLNRLRSAGTPLLRLEGEYFSPGGIGQLTTRVQAFLESLEVRSGVTGCAACGG